MKIKVMDNLTCTTGKVRPENARLFVTTLYKVINNFIKLDNLLVPEKEYKGEVIDGIEFEYHQLHVIEEEILSALDIEEVQSLARLCAQFLVGNGHNSLRIKMSMTKTSALISMLEEIVDDYLPIDEEQASEIKELLQTILRNSIFPYLRELHIINTVKNIKNNSDEIEMNMYFHEYMTARDLDSIVEAEYLNSLLTVYPVILPPLEVAPEIWDDFIANVPEDYLGEIMDLAEYVKIKDITMFNQNKLTVDDEYIDKLKKRAAKAILSQMD